MFVIVVSKLCMSYRVIMRSKSLMQSIRTKIERGSKAFWHFDTAFVFGFFCENLYQTCGGRRTREVKLGTLRTMYVCVLNLRGFLKTFTVDILKLSADHQKVKTRILNEFCCPMKNFLCKDLLKRWQLEVNL